MLHKALPVRPEQGLTTGGGSVSLDGSSLSVESIVRGADHLGTSLAGRCGRRGISSLEGRSKRRSEGGRGRGAKLLLRQAQSNSLKGHVGGSGVVGRRQAVVELLLKVAN
jgi:hypothetical protein